ELAQAYPQVKMVVTHCAQLDISGLSIGDAMILAQETEQVYFETSGVYRRDLIEGLVNDVGAHRLVFGSNFPDMNIEMELERIYAADLPDEAKAQLLGENARGIFK
ncbi:MAG: amidohydrolase family protein, partial [Deinococcus sp.]|nr:amidohydrolase family protein [Deinococcus sp.]